MSQGQDPKQQYFETYRSFATSEQHFNSIQAGIRNIASGWMLAACGAVGYVIQTGIDKTWLIDPWILVAVIACGATMGLLALWICDQLVYQRLLNAVYVLGAKWEYDDPKLPPVRLLMRTSGHGISWWVVLYYLVPMLLFLVVGLYGTWPCCCRCISSGLMLPMIQFIAIVFVIAKNQSVRSKTLTSAFGEPEFTDFIAGESGFDEKLKTRLAAHQETRNSK